MKKLLGASKLFCCNKEFQIINNGGVLFESDPSNPKNKILCFGDYQSLLEQNPDAKASFYPQHILLPALSNPHIHFEFSNNKTTLVYGDFGEWLDSVIQRREELFENLEQSIQKQIQLQLKSGIASVGAISSYGFDIAPLASSPLRVQLFNEAIGSNPALIDTLYSNLLARLQECQKHPSHQSCKSCKRKQYALKCAFFRIKSRVGMAYTIKRVFQRIFYQTFWQSQCHLHS